MSAKSRTTVGTGTAFGFAALLAPAAEAETITVTTLDNDGAGSLREAVIDADSSDDVVTFATGLSGTIELEQDLEITGHGLSIQGPGASQVTVDANDQDRVFYVFAMDDPGEQVSISGLTLTGGDTGATGDGGALYNGPGSGDAADLTLSGVVITDSYAAGSGGGVYHYAADLAIENSTISGNIAGGRGGGVTSELGALSISGSAISDNVGGFEGGGVYVDRATEMTISDSTLSGNSVDEGGGLDIDSTYGDTVIQRSSFVGNSVTDEGGGIYVNSLTEAPVTIDQTTVSGNSAESDDGGGIYVNSFKYDLLIQNSTLSGNSTGGVGGGLFADTDDNDVGTITVRNSTIAGNSADEGGGIYRFGHYVGPGDFSGDGLALSSTIVADNAGGDIAQDPDINTGAAAFVLGFSLIENPDTVTSTEAPAGSNIFGVDPLLGPLANNGGPTQTHLPAVTGPALDKGIANGLATDQRGLARTGDLGAIANAAGGDGTDIGSVEIQAADCEGQGALKIDGTEGDDGLIGTDGPDAITLLGGNDSASGVGGNDCVSGDEGRDRLSGGPGTDQVSGGAGKDRAKGNGGKDKVKGGPGKDKLLGGGGKDRLAGAGGKDRLSGGGGKDRLKGGPGKDKLVGGGGKDRFNCGGGTDKVTAQAKDKVSASCEKVVERG